MKMVKKPAKIKLAPKKSLVPGSRVPISFLFDYIREGYTLTEFLSDYPWIKKESAQKVVDRMKKESRSKYAT